MHVHQRRYQLSRPKPVLQGRLCLRASKLVLWGAPAAAEGEARESAPLPAEKAQARQPAALRAKGEHARSPWLLRRRRGDKLANQQRYLLRRHKPVNQLLLGLSASMHGLRGFCGGGGETCTCTSDATSKGTSSFSRSVSV